MKRIKHIFYLFAAGSMLVSTGCKKYLDVNKNLNDPTEVPVSILLTSAERTIGGALSVGGLSATLSAYVHQLTGRAAFDRYGVNGTSTLITTPWTNLYAAITNLDVVIDQGTKEGRFQYVGIAKILKAYTFSQMVDVWGDIPFSEFNQFKKGITQPKFDDDAAIYPQLFTLIDAGIADLNNVAINPSVPASDDVIYKGNKAKWIKAANTIKLKLYTQVRKVQNVTAQVTALLATPANLIASHDDNFVVPFGTFGTSGDDRHPGYGDYTGTQRGSQLVSHWLYENMKGVNVEYPTGVVDPRIPYYMYNQKKAGAAPENNTEYRDGGFITITFGSNGPYRDGSNSNTYTLWGLYPVGGRYDDGAGLAIAPAGSPAATAGTGAAPQRLITWADRLYLEAELIQTGVVPGDAKAVFNAALIASFSQVDWVITAHVKPTQTVPLLGAAPQAALVTAYITKIMDLYTAASATEKLEHIMTQKWLSNMGSGVDQYTDYRRTGFPIMFDPNNALHAPGGTVTNPQGTPQAKIPVSNNILYPLSLPWSQTERELNANAPAQKAPEKYKVFWQP